MSGLAYITWFPGDFLKSTRGWSVTAKGVYRELLDAQWDQDGLPHDPDELRELIGATESEWAAGWKRCEAKFPVCEDGRRRNARLEQHRQKALGKHHERVESGRKGGRSAQAQLKQSSKLSSSIPSSSSSSSSESSPSPETEKRENARKRANGASAPSRSPALTDEQLSKLKAAYPTYSGRQDWNRASKAARKLIDTGKATLEQLVKTTGRYALYVATKGRVVMRPENFFTGDPPPCLQAWDLVPEQTRADAVIDELLREQAEERARTRELK